MDSALSISKVGNHNYKIVTLTGEVINPGGALTGGSIQGKSGNLLGRKREIEEIEVKVEKLKVDYKKETQILQGIKDIIKKIDEDIIDRREEIHQKKIDLTVLDGETKNLVIEGEKIKKSLEYSSEDLKKKAIFIENLTKQLDSKKEELNLLGKKNFESKEKVKLLEEQYEIKKRNIELLKEKVTEMKISRATIDESIHCSILVYAVHLDNEYLFEFHYPQGVFAKHLYHCISQRKHAKREIFHHKLVVILFLDF